jgi:hypothetical protein
MSRCTTRSSRRQRFSLAGLFLALAPFSASAHEVHPLGLAELDWSTPQLSRTSSALMDFQTDALILSFSGLGGVQEIDGERCVVGPYFLFDVDDRLAFDLDADVELRFRLARGSAARVSYDHAVKSPPAVIADKIDADGFHTIKLPRARFANRLFAGHDIGIAATGAIYPYSTGAEFDIAICELELALPDTPSWAGAEAPEPGKLELRILDATSREPVAARIGLFDAAGRVPLISDPALPVTHYGALRYQVPIIAAREFWPAPGGYAFFVDGRFSADLPPGDYRLIAMRGTDYRLTSETVRILPGATTTRVLALEPWHDSAESRWYSGDVHIHMTRNREDNSRIMAHMRAENLHVGNLLQMANIVRQHFPQYAFGPAGLYREGEHALVSGQEAPRSGHRGHTISLDGERYYAPEPYFLYHRVAQRVRADGGLFGYAHLLGDAFHVARGLALDAVNGFVDFVEILQFGTLGTDLYYDMLNLGLRMAPAAGSDYPYIDLPGAVRNYVRVEGEFTTDAWFAGLKAGRTFVSNAPQLRLSVNGAGMGDTISIAAGDKLTIEASASINGDFDELTALELVVYGDVVAAQPADAGSDSVELVHELQPTEGLWLAIRARGRGLATAHSAPVYVEVDGRQDTFHPRAVAEIAARYIDAIEELLRSEPIAHEDLENWETGAALRHAWAEQRTELDAYARGSIARLREIARRGLPAGEEPAGAP